LTKQPVRISDPSCAPRYPADAKRNGHQGKVLARVRIDRAGFVSDAEIVRSSGFPSLDQAALEFFKCQRYEPGTVDGVPSAMSFDLPANFVLKN
jgi:TonB family protein